MMNSKRIFLIAISSILSGYISYADDILKVTLRIENGKVVEGPKVIKLRKDAIVDLTVICDSIDEIHIHGYNIISKLSPHQPTTLRLVARHTGRFTFELHKADIELGAFEIYPN